MKMKRICLLALCAMFVALSGCGKTEKKPEPVSETNTGSSVNDAPTVEQESVTWDDGDFRYLKGDLPKGWKEVEYVGTSTYLEAKYGDGENAPTLTVGVTTYNDEMGASKTKLLVEAVQKNREKEKPSEIKKLKIGGLDFYHLSYDSLKTRNMRCYVFYGQTVPDKNKAYMFVEIQLDNIKDAKQFESLKGVLDQLEFKA